MRQLEDSQDMRQVFYYVASTLDGFIAHEDGSHDGFPWDDEYGSDLLTSFPETFPARHHASCSEPR